jgi:hypothetical protein
MKDASWKHCVLYILLPDFKKVKHIYSVRSHGEKEGFWRAEDILFLDRYF